jgi:hypothetical protein
MACNDTAGIHCRLIFCVALVIALLRYDVAAQAEPTSARSPALQSAAVTSHEYENPCLQPGPLFKPEDYEGPLKKVVVYFSRKPEIKTVDAPPAEANAGVCVLAATAIFILASSLGRKVQ